MGTLGTGLDGSLSCERDSRPLRWDELTDDVTPRRFAMREALDRVERHGDLFAPVLAGGQALGAALRKLR